MSTELTAEQQKELTLYADGFLWEIGQANEPEWLAYRAAPALLDTIHNLSGQLSKAIAQANLLQYQLTVSAQAARETALREQMERDCRVVCFLCLDATTPEHNPMSASPAFEQNGSWVHLRNSLMETGIEEECFANEIRQEFALAPFARSAAAAAEAQPAGEGATLRVKGGE